MYFLPDFLHIYYWILVTDEITFLYQMELLFLFMAKDRGLSLQALALKCLHFILAKGIYHFHASSNVTLKLFGVINQSDFPPALQFEALRALYKVFLSFCQIYGIGITRLLFTFSYFADAADQPGDNSMHRDPH